VSAAVPPRSADRRTVLALVGGILFTGLYFGWLMAEPRGPFEFGYAPFGPEPLPYSPMRGFTYEQLWGHVARAALLGPGLLLLSAGLSRVRPWRYRVTTRRLALALVSVSLAITAVVMLGVLRGRAIADDELTYRMQATFFSEGRLGDATLGFMPPDFLTVGTERGYTGKYLPGEALVQVPGLLLGVPAFAHLVLLALTLFCWHRAVSLRADARFADIATAALAVSPMVTLTAATGLSETTSLCAVAVAALGLEWSRATRPYAGALLVALGVGFGLATRLQSLLPIGGILVPAAAWELVRRRRFGALGVLGTALAVCGGGIGWYDHALSGSATTVPWYLQCAIEHYGFGPVWRYDLFTHTPWTALENLGVVLVRLNAWWLGLPLSLGVLGFALWQKIPERRLGVWYLVALAIVAFEFLYYSPGASDTGSLYHHELVLPGSLVAAGAVEALLLRFPAFGPSALAVHLGLGTLPFIGEQSLRLARLVSAIHDESDAALARVTPPAVVFHELRQSEYLMVGWLLDSFPRRNRGRSEPVVTFPNVPETLRARVLAEYPGRACWYYRRDPDTAAASIVPCAEATALMNRPLDDDARPLWIEPTAYSVTGFDPRHSNALRHRRDAAGRRVVLCCALDEAEKLGAVVDPAERNRCLTRSR
jgi:hypothetical protein